MQFTTIALTLLALGASAMPAHSETDNSIAKRTCGELKGVPLKICQGVCIGACDAVSTFLLKKVCKAACTKGPLKRNNDEEDETLTMDDVTVDDLIALGHIHGDNDAALAKRDGASFGHKVCIAGCEVLCNSTVLALAQTKCLAKCKPKCN